MKDDPTKYKRRPWTGAQIAVLTQHFCHGGLEKTLAAYPAAEHHRVRAKLVELGLVPKAPKPTLSLGLKKQADGYVEDLKREAKADPTQAILAARYAIKELAALLPQRKKAEK